MSSRCRFVFGLCVIVGGGCNDGSDHLAVESSRQASSPILPSSSCSEGAGAGECAKVPPVFARTWVTDGVRDPAEYYGAVEFSFQRAVNGERATLEVTLDNKEADLRVFATDVPFDNDRPEFNVFIDFSRFVSTENSVELEDRNYFVDTDSGSFGMRQGPDWVLAAAPHPDFEVMTACTPTGPDEWTCDVELSIPFDNPGETVLPPLPGEIPGIGFAVATTSPGAPSSCPTCTSGSFPQRITFNSAPVTDRREYQTLLLAVPDGTDISFATFNAQMWGPGDFGTTAFSTNSAAFGTFVATFDIVALQEVWTEGFATSILAAANAVRKGLGLPPYFLIGPPQYPPEWIEQEIVSIADTELHGGVWILSRFPPIATDYHVFDSCQGEDCIKAKGVLWARLALQSPVTTPQTVTCALERSSDVAGCRLRPTTEFSLDVFNMHFNGPEPAFCSPEGEFLVETAEQVVQGLVNGIIGPFLDPLIDQDWHCDQIFVQLAQAEEANAFIDQIMASAPGRQAIIAGDLNIDGQFLGDSTGTGLERYGRLMEELGLLAPGADPDGSAPDDTAHAATGDFSWDIDRTDIARDVVMDWTAGMATTGFGTEIGVDATQATINALMDRDDPPDPIDPIDRDGTRRLDYIFIRPPDDPFPSDYLIRRPDNHNDLYRGVWPEVTIVGMPPTYLRSALLSDHMMLTSQFRVIPLRHPGIYNVMTDHDFRVNVISINFTGMADCSALFNCNPIDPFPNLSGSVLAGGGMGRSMIPITGTECEGWVLSEHTHACMSNWRISELQQRVNLDFEHRAAVRLFDADGSSGNDPMPSTVSPKDHPEVRFNWATQLIEIRGANSGSPVGNWTNFNVETTDPIEWCTQAGRGQMCLRTELAETHP